MSLDRDAFLISLEQQAGYCKERSPLYERLLHALRRDLAQTSPAWFDRARESWRERSFATPYEAPLLLLAGVHFRALIGGDDGLRSAFPSCGGKEDDAEHAVLHFLSAAPDDFWTDLRGRRLQTNEPARAVGWLLVAASAFIPRAAPFHLVDLGASGGLSLIGDYLPRRCEIQDEDGRSSLEPTGWRQTPFPVLTRLGLDAEPRRLSDRLDRLWLKACIWAGDAERHARFDEAAQLFVKLSLDLSGPKLERCIFTDMPAFVSFKIRPHAEEGLLLFNSQASDFLGDEDYRRFSEGVARALEPWGDRGFWVELELPRGKGAGFHQLTAHRLVKGKLISKVLASCKAHPSSIRLKPGWDFLAPLAPVRGPRITREESPKRLEPGRFKFPP